MRNYACIEPRSQFPNNQTRHVRWWCYYETSLLVKAKKRIKYKRRKVRTIWKCLSNQMYSLTLFILTIYNIDGAIRFTNSTTIWEMRNCNILFFLIMIFLVCPCTEACCHWFLNKFDLNIVNVKLSKCSSLRIFVPAWWMVGTIENFNKANSREFLLHPTKSPKKY